MAEEAAQAAPPALPLNAKYYENLLQFQSEVINPESQTDLPFINRDVVLGNIKQGDLNVLADWQSDANLFSVEGFHLAAFVYNSQIKSRLALSRSVDMEQQKILSTTIQKQDVKQATTETKPQQSGGFLGKIFRRR